MTRQHGIWLALLLTLAACYWVTIQENAQENEVIESAKLQPAQKYIYRDANKVIDNSLSGHLNDKKLILRSIDSATPGNLFSSFETVEEASLASAENQVPSLPTNPYTYAGKITDDGDWTVFLSDGAKNFAVKTGDVLENGWRVQDIKQTQLTLMYQPLKQTIKLDIGATF
jgi:hypothetical protein